ncbi:MAG TPA: hypothetical protein PLN48_14880 [Lachnospiraceae bacterium]|nr:hypothetical protein [Lachnospiraceae bacterium]
MLMAIFAIFLVALVFRGIFAVLGFACKTAFWIIIGIPAAIILFSMGIILLGAIILAGCLVAGVFKVLT